MKKVFYILAVFIFILTGTAYAEYYTWEDENGVTQITDYPPPSSLKAQKLQKHQIVEPSTDESNLQTPKSTSKPDITLYTKDKCADCDKARSFLEAEGYPFKEYNMDTDETAVEKRKAVDDGTDVPFAMINKHRIYGFSESVYNRALKSK